MIITKGSPTSVTTGAAGQSIVVFAVPGMAAGNITMGLRPGTANNGKVLITSSGGLDAEIQLTAGDVQDNTGTDKVTGVVSGGPAILTVTVPLAPAYKHVVVTVT